MREEISEAVLRRLKAKENFELFKAILMHISARPRNEGRNYQVVESLMPGLTLKDKHLKFLVDNGFLTFSSLPPSGTGNIYRGYRYCDLPDTILWSLHDAREIVRKMLLDKLTTETQLDDGAVDSVTYSIIHAMQRSGLLGAIDYGGHIAT